jgi:hypothetical protein
MDVISILAHDQCIDPGCLHGGEGRVEVTLIAGRPFFGFEALRRAPPPLRQWPAIASISRALSRPLAAEERMSWLIRGR